VREQPVQFSMSVPTKDLSFDDPPVEDAAPELPPDSPPPSNKRKRVKSPADARFNDSVATQACLFWP
jgi:hypothetical protein